MRRTSGTFGSLLCAGLLAGCTVSDGESPGVYRDKYVSLHYPAGWTARSVMGRLSVESGSLESGILTITRERSNVAPSLGEYARRVSRAAQGGFFGLGRQVPGGSRMSEEKDDQGRPVIRETVRLEAFGQTLTYHREYRLRVAGGFNFYLLSQVDEEDRGHTESDFRAILDSLEFVPEGSP